MARSRRRGTFGFIRSLNRLAFLPLATRVPTYGRLVVALFRDERIPWSTKAVLGVAAGYLISPIDIIPEFVPIVGALDDVAVIVLALDVFLETIPRPVLDEKLRELDIDPSELESDLRQVRRYVPKPIRRLAMRLPEAIDAVGVAAKRTGLDRRVREWVGADDRERARRARPVSRPRPAESDGARATASARASEETTSA